MKVLMVNGSPRLNECTSVALKDIEKVLNLQDIDTEILTK